MKLFFGRNLFVYCFTFVAIQKCFFAEVFIPTLKGQIYFKKSELFFTISTMADSKDKWRQWIKKITSKYRLVIMNDETFEEVSNFRLSRMNVFILFSTIIVITVFFTVSAVMFTPLKEYVPGYGNTSSRKIEPQLIRSIDSLSELTKANDDYIANLRDIVNGNVKIVKSDTPIKVNPNYKLDTTDVSLPSPGEQQYRNDYSSTDNLSLSLVKGKMGGHSKNISDFYFFTPVNGYVTIDTVNVGQKHYGVDISAPENSPIKATLDGKVVLSTWTVDGGYVIAIQHDNNLLSLYKHNSVLLKQEGDYVKAGDVIALIGNSGELSTGTHLHFELWLNGIPLNPKDYIIFK